ncbi:hypothetical protein [Clostridium sp. CF012]|uniref:hypothetical protein n=1 Tax=Clostridium sp. CF012 TaxID=2843319 RepID=UPI001C0D147D|nr:hypothetical protein [Clostridium sp. CF012]MBU3145023.1 hypothetical protein [Clostridium sp. CF012]
MTTLTNIYINKNGELNFDNVGRLASLLDLQEEVCCTGIIFNELLQTSDGIVKWQSAEQQRKILELDEDITEEEMQAVEGEYFLINKDVPSLYTNFINDIDLEEVLTVTFNEDNLMLVAITKLWNNNWTYIYNYFIDNKNELQKNKNMIPTFMLKAICNTVA